MNEFNPSFSRKMKQTISSTFLSISSIQNGNDYPFGISLLYPWVFPLSGHPIHWPFFKNRFAELEIAFSHCDPIFKRKNRTLKGRKNSGHSRTGFRHLVSVRNCSSRKGQFVPFARFWVLRKGDAMTCVDIATLFYNVHFSEPDFRVLLAVSDFSVTFEIVLNLMVSPIEGFVVDTSWFRLESKLCLELKYLEKLWLVTVSVLYKISSKNFPGIEQ